ncbi:MAG: FMN-binding protein [Spirochaetaceae bacterium]|nr:FMN-binding protein [Spirochaetaceae bacterium]
MNKKTMGIALAMFGAAALAFGQDGGILVKNAFKYTHINGHKHEEEMTAFVLFEYEQLKTVKYQVAYIACTCRGPEVNYYSVAYVELNKADGSVKHLSYDLDSDEHYTAGMYGDSETSWDGTEVKELFAGFIKDRIVGKSQAEINAYKTMHGNVDAFTGATVTPNNAMRMLQGLFAYHNTKYR